MKKTIVLVLKKLYRALPIKNSSKQKIKNKLISKFKIFSRIDNYNVNNLNKNYHLAHECIKFDDIKSINSINKKIAVHLHLYYVDLSDEFKKYLSNLPYEYDLFLSIQENGDIKKAEQLFKDIPNTGKIIVKKVKNIGRDFSPMFITFKKELLNYDYLLHVHTKKSIRTGSQQDGWRKHMLDGVLGNKNVVEKIFSQFENGDNIGLIYPETYYDMPYWAHTWLKNKNYSNDIANKLGFCIENEYIDYSVGSFFWVRVDAIKKFLNLNFSYDDFGNEEGKADGTLAHSIERMIPQVVINSGYKYLVVDKVNKVFRYTGIKNLYQYDQKNKDECINVLKKYDIISFDIFDTLISRKISKPDRIFDLLSNYVEEKYNITNFKKIRIDSEFNVRVDKNFLGDCSIHEIYNKIEECTKLTEKQCTEIKNKEIEFEIAFAVPKNDMLDIFNSLKNCGKQIILISDMYLTKDIITKMLTKCGYTGFNEILVSSETGLRKDNGTIWNYYYETIVKEKSSIHVGDNEQSDVQQLCDFGKPFYHVMQSNMMYKLSEHYKYIKNNNITMNLCDDIAFGLILNKVFYNSPFVNINDVLIDNFHDFGYAVLAPVIFNYMVFLQNNTENKYDELLFLSREGYYLQKIYKAFCKKFKHKEINNTYFLTSRRATSVSCINSIDDAKEILTTGYEGSLNNLFKTRLGINDKDISDKFIKLDETKNEVMKILEEKYDDYKKQFDQEKKNYKKYCQKVFKSKTKIAVCDLGYSGTIQYYLMKLNNIKIDGYYFTLSDNLKPKKLGGECFGCFNQSIEEEKNILLFSMILETFLTAPFGQLIKFDSKGNPIYKDENIDKKFMDNLDQICDGVIEFISDISELNYNGILNNGLSNSYVSANFSSVVYLDNVLSKTIKDKFKLENSYSLDSSINVFDYLNFVYKKNR